MFIAKAYSISGQLATNDIASSSNDTLLFLMIFSCTYSVSLSLIVRSYFSFEFAPSHHLTAKQAAEDAALSGGTVR